MKVVSAKTKKNVPFWLRILPTTGKICAVVKTISNKLIHHWFGTREEAVSKIEELDKDNAQAYIAQASFKNEGTKWEGRTQANAAYHRCFFMDIDCGVDEYGKPKPYPTQEDGERALLAFCEKTGLPEPAIVNSGNGLYAYWIFTSNVKSKKWVVGAKKLKKLVRAYEPGLDKDGLITDSARILRPVGSTHRKDPQNPKKVRLIQDCDPINFNDLNKLLTHAIASVPAKPAPTVKLQRPDVTGDSSKKLSAIKIAESCPVIGHIKDTRGNVPEPVWYAGIGVLRHCQESPGIIHDWSNGHPTYSIEETDSKIAQHKMPPTTCAHFAGLCPELCNQCQYQGKITSPIYFGVDQSAELPDYMQELNSEHFVSRLGGKTVVFRQAFDKQLKRKFIEKSSFGDFKNFYNNQKAIVGLNKDGSPLTMPLGNAWLDHEGRRQFNGIIMSPGEDVDGYFNLWQGFAVEAVEGSWKLMKKHIYTVICNRDRKLYKYVISWLARLIQEPGTQGEVALVLKGGKGIGKGMLANSMCRILGQHSCSVRNSKHVTGNFNAHMDDCVLLYVDEAFWAGNKDAESVLKGIITEPTLFIVPKHIDGKEKRNMLHIIMTSNNEWVVPASLDERRYCVLEVSEHRKKDIPYFKALANEINNGGLEAMLFYLKNLDISKFEVRDVPHTSGLIEQKIQSLDTVEAWWHQKLICGELIPGLGWNVVQTQDLYEDYVSSVQKINNSIRRASNTAFGIQLKKMLPKGWPKKLRQTSIDEFGRRPNEYEFPKLKTCRKKFEEMLGTDAYDWE